MGSLLEEPETKQFFFSELLRYWWLSCNPLLHLLSLSLNLPIYSHLPFIPTHKRLEEKTKQITNTTKWYLKSWDSYSSLSPESDISEMASKEGEENTGYHLPLSYRQKLIYCVIWFGFESKALHCKMNYSHFLFIDLNSVGIIKLVNEHLYIIVFFV